MTATRTFDLLITEGIRLEEDAEGKKRVVERVYQGNSSAEWAGKAASKLKFDEGYDITNVYRTTKMNWNKETKAYE